MLRVEIISLKSGLNNENVYFSSFTFKYLNVNENKSLFLFIIDRKGWWGLKCFIKSELEIIEPILHLFDRSSRYLYSIKVNTFISSLVSVVFMNLKLSWSWWDNYTLWCQTVDHWWLTDTTVSPRDSSQVSIHQWSYFRISN